MDSDRVSICFYRFSRRICRIIYRFSMGVITSSYRFSKVFYRSSLDFATAIVAPRCALLISSHYDSALSSPAASDANVAGRRDPKSTRRGLKTARKRRKTSENLGKSNKKLRKNMEKSWKRRQEWPGHASARAGARVRDGTGHLAGEACRLDEPRF